MQTIEVNVIDLYLLENRSITAKVNGYPIDNQNGYKIIAGEENATQFKIASIPEKYEYYTLTVEMVNSRGYGIEETEIKDKMFTLPVGMAVAGYGEIQIRAKRTIDDEEINVPFYLIKVKVHNTLSNWKENIDPTELDKIKATLTEIQSEINEIPNNYVPKASGSNVAYINDQNGGTATKPFAVDVTDNALVARSGNGQIRLPLAPLQGYDATSKNYVDESIEALPSKYVTLDTDQTIDGTKGFTSPITVGGQTWHTVYMKDSFVYTVDGYSYEVTYPEKSGLMALKSDIPTDYATQSQLAQTNQNVEDLYTILEQAQVVTVTTLEQAYTTRETADGENIVDGVQTTVKEIRGKTVKSENLLPYPYVETTKTMYGVTFTDNGDGSVTINGTSTGYTMFYFVQNNADFFTVGKTYVYSVPHGLIAYKEAEDGEIKYISSAPFTWVSGWILLSIYIQLPPDVAENNLTVYPMLNEGSTAKPYTPYFPGLKNASFEKIVSTGRNLIDLSGVSLEKTVNGITFTKQADGQYHATGTIADPSQGASPTVNINQGKVYPAGVYSTARYTVDGKDIEFFVSAYSEKTGAVIRNIDGANVTINEDFVIKTAGIYVNRAITGVIDLTVSTMLNYGTSALPYEPYISDTLSAETPIELTEYDVAYPETGETKRQSKTITFNGTETFIIYTPSENNKQEGYTVFVAPLNPKGVSPEQGQNSIVNNYQWKSYGYASAISGTCQCTDSEGRSLFIKQNQFSTMDEWKAHLAELAAAGNPLTVTYKTAESTTESTPFNKSKYIAWKNGSETIKQGANDNSEYGAENTVKQDYFTLTGGTTNDTNN